MRRPFRYQPGRGRPRWALPDQCPWHQQRLRERRGFYRMLHAWRLLEWLDDMAPVVERSVADTLIEVSHVTRIHVFARRPAALLGRLSDVDRGRMAVEATGPVFSVFLDQPFAVEVLQHDAPYPLGPILHARELAERIELEHPALWKDWITPRLPPPPSAWQPAPPGYQPPTYDPLPGFEMFSDDSWDWPL